MNRDEKKAFVAEMNGIFQQSSIVVVSHYKGLNVDHMGDLRGKVRESGAGFKVTKNRLTRLALAGTKFEGLADLFTGPTAITFSVDPVAAAKATVGFAKGNDKLVILGAGLGEQRLDQAGVKALSDLPSLDQLRAKLLGVLSAPATKVAGVVQAPASQLARVVQAYASKDQAA